MPVHPGDSHLKIGTFVFESRFGDGYRYLDRCGDTLLKIRAHDPGWVPLKTDPQNGVVMNLRKNLQLVFDSERMVLSECKGDPILAKDTGSLVQSLADEADVIYEIITSNLQIEETTRVGARFSFNAPVDTLEEAERFLVRIADSDVGNKIVELTRATLYQANYNFRVEEDDTGYRKTVQINVIQTREQGQPSPTGFPEDVGNVAISLDIDTFTRPVGGPFEDTRRFVLNAHSRSHELVKQLLSWMVRQR